MEALRDCSCKSAPDKDGCHRCILKQQRNQSKNSPSRQTAIQLLEHILTQGTSLKPIKSLSTIDINPLLESHLEQSFLAALVNVPNTKFRTHLVDGKEGYLYTIGDKTWEVIPQVDISESLSIPHSTRPDFVLRPLRRSHALPIALYLDGFAFHADEEGGNNRIAKDIAQREGLRRSGEWNVWSLTSKDLATVEEEPTHPGQSRPEIEQRKSLVKDLLPDGLVRSNMETTLSCWPLLLTFLEEPTRDIWSQAAYALALSLGSVQPYSSPFAKQSLTTLLSLKKSAPPSEDTELNLSLIHI